MKRTIIQQLIDWKNYPDRRPLILMGARQVGKTWIAKEFGRQHFAKVAYIRFDQDLEIRKSFREDFNIKRLLNDIQTRTRVALTPQDTLIILDEIQECPAAITALKYFCEDAREYAIIAAGSLLGVAEHEGTGFPVGKVDRLYMHPMTFTEYLEGTGDEVFAELVRHGEWRQINLFARELSNQLRRYYFVGGMPGVVSTYMESNDLHRVRDKQLGLLNDYKNDFSKHAKLEIAQNIALAWESIPSQLGKEDKRFLYNQVQPGMHARHLRAPLHWLEEAGLVSPVPRATTPQYPLEGFKDAAFKLYFLDVGLLAAKCRLNSQLLLNPSAVFTQYKGALTEQYVQQQLRAECNMEPYYWTAERAQAEVDFLLPTDDGIFPMEVKAERNLKARSLQSFYRRYRQPLAVRCSMAPHSVTKVEIPATKDAPAGSYTLLDIPLHAVCRVADECARLCGQEPPAS